MPKHNLAYEPKPIDTSKVKLSREIIELTEILAKNAHDIWASRRMADGWHYGPARDDKRKENPTLVPYEELPESEKEYDRDAALETLKAILALGYRMAKVGDRGGAQANSRRPTTVRRQR